MKKVLFIDYPSFIGHINFNRIYIDSLKEQGFEVKVVVKSSIGKHLGYEKKVYERSIPDFLYQNSRFTLINRFFLLLQHCFVRFFVKSSSYDVLIFSCFDPIVSFLLPFKQPVYLVLHAANDVNTKVKGFFLKSLGRKNTFIVFTQEMKDVLISNGIKSVLLISHGCIPPFAESYLHQEYIEAELAERLKENNFRVLFMPSSSSSDYAFISKLFYNKQFIDFLSDNNLLLVLNRIKVQFKHPNILILSNKLSEGSYRKLFLESSIIIISYPASFKYRVSGVFFECLANKKQVVIKELPAFEFCRAYFNYTPQFRNEDELIGLIDDLLQHPNKKCIVDGKAIRPDFNGLN